MKRVAFARVAAMATAITLTACADRTAPQSVDDERRALGSCSLGADAHVRAEPIHSRLTKHLRWVRASGLVKDADPPPNDQDRRATVRLERAAPFAGPAGTSPDEPLSVFAPNLPHVDRARAAGRDLVAGVDARRRIVILAAVDSAGDVAFVGDCQHRFMTGPFDSYVTARGNGRRAVDVLRDVVSSPVAAKDFVTFFDPPEPAGWHATAPDRRQLDEGSTPAEVMATLRSVAVHYDLPREWRTHREVELCTRLTIAWAECTSLTAWAAVDGPITFRSYVLPGEGVEVWAVDERTTITSPLGRVAVVPAAAVTRALAGGVAIVLAPVDGIETFEQFQAAIAEGRDALRVTAPA